METLQPELIGKICSYTDDNTIYNLSVAKKMLSTIVNNSKKDILLQREKERTYDHYPIFNKQSLQATKIDTHVHVVDDTSIEDVHTFETSKLTSSVIILTSESPTHEQLSHLITSIRVIGDIHQLQLTFADHTIYPIELPIKCFRHDEHGYIEILTQFAPFLPLFCSQHLDTLLSVKTQGKISVRVRKCCISQFYITSLRWSRLPCLLPVTKMFENLAVIARTVNGNTQYIPIPCQETLQEHRSIGLYITIKNNHNEHIKKHYIRAFVLSMCCDNREKEYIVSARSCHTSAICKTVHYNFPVKFSQGFYIPLSQILLESSFNTQASTCYLKIVLKTNMTTSFAVDIRHFYQDQFKFHPTDSTVQYEI